MTEKQSSINITRKQQRFKSKTQWKWKLQRQKKALLQNMGPKS